ncbi:MAG TPA: cation:proton antiporter [Candidatus Paceibacterota bacterium]
MTTTLFELAMVVLLATGLGIVAKVLRQPTILGYLVAGALIGAFGFLNLSDEKTFRVFSDLGIMFLLFLVGLEINYTSLRLVGRVSLLVGLGQIVFTFGLGYGIAVFLFGLGPLAASYIAIALTFSSTIIVVKLLADKKDISSLYGRISVGFLLVQDFVAIVVLVALAGISQGNEVAWWVVAWTVVQGIVLFAAMLWLGRKIFPYIFDALARSSELLFLSSLAWVLSLAAVVSKINFSIEIAGFLAGIALANSSEHFQIASRIRPLRDFFIVIFFVLLGSSLAFSHFSGLWVSILVFSFFVLIGNPIIVWIIMGLMGYRRRTFFLAGITVAQISEFSLIIVALGARLGHINESVVALVTAVGIVTIAVSTYFIVFGDRLVRSFYWWLGVFERRISREEIANITLSRKRIVVIGAHRIGHHLLHNLPKQNVLVVDFDPEAVRRLREEGYDCLFGDIEDEEIRERAELANAALVVSTSPHFEDNASLLEYALTLARRPKMIVRAEVERDAFMLYNLGADYVIIPHLTSGFYLGKALALDPQGATLDQLRKKDMALMAEERASFLSSPLLP